MHSAQTADRLKTISQKHKQHRSQVLSDLVKAAKQTLFCPCPCGYWDYPSFPLPRTSAMTTLSRISRSFLCPKPFHTGGLSGLATQPSVSKEAKFTSLDAVDPNEVTFQKINATGVIQLNKPKSLNSLTLNMVRLMHERLKEWKDEKVKLVICKGGEKAFCAGGDIVAIYRAGKDAGSLFQDDFFRGEYTLDYQTTTLGVPYVAFMHGITMGGGVGISVHGTYRVATEKTMFAMPETAIGFFVDVGGSYFLPRLKGNLGTFLALTGNRLVGKDTKHAGLATHFVDAALLSQLEKDLVSLDNPVNANIEEVLERYEKKSTSQKDHEFTFSRESDIIQRAFGASTVENILKELQKENSEWSRKQLETIRKMSPTSVKLALRQMQEGQSKSLEQCLKMEFRISQRILQGNDFYEGVRAKLVDKDNAPRWKPATVEDVSDADIDAHFEPFSNPQKELRLERG